MKDYDHRTIEKKWQEIWEKDGMYRAEESSDKPKQYVLDMFPYPSGDGLHTGHVENYTATCIYARYMRMKGFNVLHPIGWDAFGLPSENYAIKTGVHPDISTHKNIKNFTAQMKSLGFSVDWTRDIDTSSPAYYRFTQWFFLLLYKNGLAYKKKAKANWCDSCKTVLANEQAAGGVCERCKNEVVQKDIEQWLFKITDFAEDLINDLDTVDWPSSTIAAQRNWIGKSEGATIKFKIKKEELKNADQKFTQLEAGRERPSALAGSKGEDLTVFTTRPDTLFGATYVVLAPEHPLLTALSSSIQNLSDVVAYQEQTTRKTDLERTALAKDKTGVRLEGVMAVNPANNEEIPIFVADYVLAQYGTGAVMAVPAHDERDFAFAKKFNLSVKEVVIPNRIDKKNPPVSGKRSAERKNVHALVRNPKNNKFLCLRSKEFHWITFPMGGIEEGEDVISAAIREVEEETGYKNLKLIKVLGGEVRAEYFAKHKDENRIAYTTGVLFDLINEERSPVDKEWEDSHELMWIDEKNVNYDTLCHAEMDVWNERLKGEAAYMEEGVLVNSGEFNGLSSEEARKKITKFVNGSWMTKYKLRDWLVSRQRYWGAPIPIIYCDTCGEVPVPEKDLPVRLPTDVDFLPTGESPLARSESFQTVICPQCGKKARRESDTMDTFVCSSWYYFRFADPRNETEFASRNNIRKWLPVDMYMGGAEHTVLHLLYARFFTKVLKKLDFIDFNEPFLKLRHQGIILAEDGRKMSKSFGNVINPNDLIEQYGADTLRIHEMFLGPLEDMKAWNTASIVGPRRFLERVWRLGEKVVPAGDTHDIETVLHKTIKKVGEDIETFSLNTAISSLMVLLNEMESATLLVREDYETFLVLLAPFAPHITEELWHILGNTESIHRIPWPLYDPAKTIAQEVTIAIQVNGKVRDTITVPVDWGDEEVTRAALERPLVVKWVGGQEIKKVFVVKGRMVSIVA